MLFLQKLFLFLELSLPIIKLQNMRKLLLVLLVLASSFSIIMAQPATKGSFEQGIRDGLQVEILDSNGGHFDHPQHPANGIMCNSDYWFTTEELWNATYLWETSAMAITSFDGPYFGCNFQESGYLKLTVWDEGGNSGFDSIWFNVKSGVLYPMQPMENFVMEIDDNLHANFSGTASIEHMELWIQRTNNNGASQFEVGDFWLTPGEWSFIDNVVYSDEDLWMYYVRLFDTCGNYQDTYVSGLLLSAVTDGSMNYLSTLTVLQQYGNYYHQFGEWVYFVYTVDQNGVRHHFVENGEPVVLPDDATRWEIPGPHADPYYQCGVAQVLEDGTYKLLSLSNIVPNPLLDPTGIDEHNDSFCVYPNPAQGRFTVEGTGSLCVINTLGQTILTQEIDGKMTVELPKGLYFAKMGNVVRKIVVE